MKILLTSGGTKIPIDEVRSITNMSNGTFGARIAEVFLRETHADITFLMAKRSASPCKLTLDIRDDPIKIMEAVKDKMTVLAKVRGQLGFSSPSRYNEIEYTTFDDYRDTIRTLIEREKPDVIILAAAVSDYGTKPVDGKIRSGKDMTIELEPLPKVISEIRSLSPDSILVGFKLLVNSTEEELIAAARDSINKNGCDIVVANDWRDMKAGNHKVIIVERDFIYPLEFNSSTTDPLHQACEVVKAVGRSYSKMRKEKFGAINESY